MSTPTRAQQIGVDIGGTFTDLVSADGSGNLRILKIPTTRDRENIAVRQAVTQLLAGENLPASSIVRFVHGTTVATNAVLERRGARTGLLTTEGFRDVLEIGRQNRENIYDPFFESGAPTFLVASARRKEVRERLGFDGSVVTPLDVASLRRAIAELVEEDVEAIAVCYLFSFLNPAHEMLTREIIAEIAPELEVSLSCEVDPAVREYERTCSTAFDAYVKPRLRRYLASIATDLAAISVAAPAQVIQSRGGVSAFPVALRRPGRLFLSGPAAGVIGGQLIGRILGLRDLVTIDVGGTSSDIALITDGKPAIRSEGKIDGFTVRIPMVDVNAIGAGGGSIAWIDESGGMRVGPRSAGAVPGPACYGKGGMEATVTDASVVLGYVDPDYFAGGTLKLDPALAHEAVKSTVARPLGLTTEQAALGIHQVVNAQMAEGIRLVSVKRGVDPRRYTLVPLGGGGALHATELAADLGISRIAVPLNPGVLSAIGLLAAPVEHEVSASFYKTIDEASLEEIRAAFDELDLRCGTLMAAEHDTAGVEIGHFADMCYVGQSYHIEVPLSDLNDGTVARLYEDFLVAHDQVYGHSVRNPARLVNLRTVHRAAASFELGMQVYRPSGGPALKGRRGVVIAGDGERAEATVWDRLALEPGMRIEGPAILEQSDTTTMFGSGWTAEVAASGNLILNRGGGR